MTVVSIVRGKQSSPIVCCQIASVQRWTSWQSLQIAWHRKSSRRSSCVAVGARKKDASPWRRMTAQDSVGAIVIGAGLGMAGCAAARRRRCYSSSSPMEACAYIAQARAVPLGPDGLSWRGWGEADLTLISPHLNWIGLTSPQFEFESGWPHLNWIGLILATCSPA